MIIDLWLMCAVSSDDTQHQHWTPAVHLDGANSTAAF